MSSHETSLPAGRPRGFVPEDALQAALVVFWRQGYEATSLTDLTAAMGLGRSSFYACFGSKHAVLMAAVRRYADEKFADFVAVTEAQPDPSAAVRAIIDAIADPLGGDRGCLFVNSVTELAPHDPELVELARTHIGRVASLVTALLIRMGFQPDLAERRTGALLSGAVGATMLRKAGMPAAAIVDLLAEATVLLNHP